MSSSTTRYSWLGSSNAAASLINRSDQDNVADAEPVGTTNDCESRLVLLEVPCNTASNCPSIGAKGSESARVSKLPLLISTSPSRSTLLIVQPLNPADSNPPLTIRFLDCEPASSAGLPAKRACVKVGPPLSANIPSKGSASVRWSPVALKLSTALPVLTKLCPNDRNEFVVPMTKSTSLAAFAETMLDSISVRVTSDPSLAMPPPASAGATLPVMVLLRMTASPRSLNRPPPWDPLVLPEIVVFVIVVVLATESPVRQMPPPSVCAEFPEIVLAVTRNWLPE